MNLLKIILSTSAFAIASVALHAQLPTKVESFPVRDVRLTASPFKHAEDMDIRYLLGIDPDRLLAPYLKEAGLSPKAENYTNWENTGLDGHIGGHYLSALSYMYAATGNKEIKARLDYMISKLKRCQDAAGDGYLCGVPNGRKMWKEIEEGNIRASGFGLNDRWVPLYNIHKIYAGLRDATLQTDSREAKEMLVKLTDWMIRLVSKLSDEQIQDMLRSEHGGLNETFADVAAITGDKRYLKLAHQFSHHTVLQPLLRQEDKLTGMHANTQIPKVIGFKRIADLEGNRDWSEAARYFWETVVDHRSITIGGNSVREHFHPADDFSSMLTSEQGPETCNTYNMLRLTKMLYETSADVHFMDYYERALYNHILSTQDPVQGGFVYFTPMRAGHYRVYSQPQTSFWCCVGSGMENHARYGEMIYGHKDNNLYVNLFIPSTLRWGDTQIEQQTAFPDEEGSTLVISPEKGKKEFTLLFRVPEWTNPEALRLSVNGEQQKVTVKEGYVSLNRTWSKGDKVRLELPMHLRAIALPDGSANYSILYGPIVLAAQLGKQNQDGMFADDSRGGHIAHGKQIPLQEVPMLIGNPDSICKSLQKEQNSRITFNYNGEVYPAQGKALELVPFFRLHNSRYAVYFRQASEEQFKAIQEEMATAERKATELANQTIDLIFPGEQQPESDHGIQYEQAETRTNKDRHFRRAKGWFGYQLKVKEEASRLLITVRKDDRNKVAILLNNEKLAVHPTVSEADKDGFITLSYVLPQKLNTGSCPIRFIPDGTEWTSAVYEVRLLK